MILQFLSGAATCPRDPRAIDPAALQRLIAANMVSIEQPVSTPRGGRPTTGKLVRVAEYYNLLNQPAVGLLHALAVKNGLNVGSLMNTCSRLRREKRLAK